MDGFSKFQLSGYQLMSKSEAYAGFLKTITPWMDNDPLSCTSIYQHMHHLDDNPLRLWRCKENFTAGGIGWGTLLS
jgi:hypothetical protein